ncbi:MAG: hypothetical protein ACLTSX_04315 [Collinsella sp.]
MVGRVWRVTSTDKNRPVLNGVYMTVENNTIRLVARPDSYRLAGVRHRRSRPPRSRAASS